jgi:hypothetical protein
MTNIVEKLNKTTKQTTVGKDALRFGLASVAVSQSDIAPRTDLHVAFIFNTLLQLFNACEYQHATF